jgi:hypothetical protein
MAIDPRQEILRMMMAQGGGMPPGGAQMANMARSMNELGTRQRPSESGGGGGGGGLPFGRGRPMPPQSVPQPEMPPMPQSVPAQPYEGMSQGYPEQELMDDSAGLPPEVMQLAALGIRPGDMMGRPPVDRAQTGAPDDVDPMESFQRGMDTEIDSEDETNVPPMSDEPPEQDPRFGPNQDPVRDETEGELEQVRETMGADEEGEQDWEGDRTPTPADLEYVRDHPTDGVLASFFERFPDWTAEDILMRGGDPSKSPDQYAMDDDEYAETQRDRSTRIDER